MAGWVSLQRLTGSPSRKAVPVNSQVGKPLDTIRPTCIQRHEFRARVIACWRASSSTYDWSSRLENFQL